MLIKHWMSSPVRTIEPGASMPIASDMMQRYGIHSLPVVEKGKLVGILTDRDLKRASASDATSLDFYELAYLLQRIEVKQIMTPDPLVIESDRTLAEAADILLREKVSVLPVIGDNKALIGILSPSDMSRALLSLMAFDRPGIQLGVQVNDNPGAAMAVAGCISSAGGRIASLISTTSHVPDGFRQVFIRVYDLDHWKLDDLVRAIRCRGTLLYVVDHVHDYRQIFAAA